MHVAIAPCKGHCGPAFCFAILYLLLSTDCKTSGTQPIRPLNLLPGYVSPLWISAMDSSCDCARMLVIHDNDAIRADCAFRHLERCRDRAIGKQPFSTAQRDRIDHQPERIDQIMLHERLHEITTSPHV